MLTAARGGETRGATWEEIDEEAREWRIPASRMKAGTLHRVPLSDAAMAVLEEARPLSGGTGLIFPSPTGRGGLSNMTLTKILRDNGLADRATVHGMRSAFRDWCADSGVSREIAEAALAHTVGRVWKAPISAPTYWSAAHRHAGMGGLSGHQRHRRQGGPAARLNRRYIVDTGPLRAGFSFAPMECSRKSERLFSLSLNMGKTALPSRTTLCHYVPQRPR